jgi:hypothetical protein
LLLLFGSQDISDGVLSEAHGINSFGGDQIE